MTWHRASLICVLVSLALSACRTVPAAQAEGLLTDTVVDEAGDPVQGAFVSRVAEFDVTLPGVGFVTDAKGRYRTDAIPPGP